MTDRTDEHRRLLTQTLSSWRPDLTGTLVFVCAGHEVLLIHKKTGHGAGLINGPGGKLQADETPAACARRELREELGVEVATLLPAATLRFVELAGDQWLGYAFVGHGLQGTPTETAEARPAWFSVDRLPLDQMWQDDAIWLPPVLAGATVAADFLFRDSILLASALRVTGQQPNRWAAAHRAGARQSAASRTHRPPRAPELEES